MSVGEDWSGCGDRRSGDRSVLRSEEENNDDIDDAPIDLFSIEKEVLWLSLPAVRDNEDTAGNKWSPRAKLGYSVLLL